MSANATFFAKSQDAHSTVVADNLPSNVFDWRAKPAIKSPAELGHEAYKADQLVRYHERKAGIPRDRSYSTRFKTPEALEAHKANARAWAKANTIKATAARMLLNATRVNPETHWAAPSGEALHRKEIRHELAVAA